MANSLVLFERGAAMLAEANTIQKAKELKDLSLTAADWAKRKGMGEEAVQYCRGYALEAERRMGELLLATEREKGGRPKKTSNGTSQVSEKTLKALKIGRRASAEAQLLAKTPRKKFEEVKAGKVTKADLRREKKKKEHAAKVEQAAAAKSGGEVEGPYDLVLADPPWRYEHCEANNREIENQYETLSLEEIGRQSPEVKEDSILLLWATAPKLKEALWVMATWGFDYRSCAVWDKEVIGMGYWWRIQHELLLVGVKGNPGSTPESERVASVFREKRKGHSQKPEVVYEWIERAFPLAKKLEMYCRTPRKGWGIFGNEC